MSIFQEFFSGFAKSKKTPKAQNLEWMQVLEKKTNTMLLVISSILDKNDRNHQIQQLKRLYTLITDFSPMLQQELQVVITDTSFFFRLKNYLIWFFLINIVGSQLFLWLTLSSRTNIDLLS